MTNLPFIIAIPQLDRRAALALNTTSRIGVPLTRRGHGRHRRRVERGSLVAERRWGPAGHRREVLARPAHRNGQLHDSDWPCRRGRNGFQPQLTLVYSTGNGNGPFGLGWSLSVPGVSRKTSAGVPRYDDAQDTFLLSGAEDLVPVARNGATVRYRPRTEGLFARIERRHGATDDYWEVRTKDGHVSLYGTPQCAGTDPAAVADPADRRKVFCWKLSLTTDPFGNRIEYEYERDAGTVGPHRFDQLYLRRIRYVDYTADGETRFLVSVTFVYEDVERPDPFSEYRAGLRDPHAQALRAHRDAHPRGRRSPGAQRALHLPRSADRSCASRPTQRRLAAQPHHGRRPRR